MRISAWGMARHPMVVLLAVFVALVAAASAAWAIDDAPPPPGAVPSYRGPVANAARQPAGALSGVTVFVSAGHGWTAGSSSWALQRPVLFDMVEDYGNLDQLNYFVHYAFNAGATVVPMRPVGYQDTEIVLDNDDPGVTYTGAWSNSTSGKYYENNATISGVSYRFSTRSATETATARYTPTIPAGDFYPVYTFAIAGTNRSRQTYRIVHSGGTSEVVVDHRETGNGWIWLGNYYFETGTGGYVEISNQSPAGSVVIADAIRFGNGMGDVSRGAAGISGFPRDQEAQRYWAHSELGNNAIGFSSSIWNTSGDDLSDNVGTGGRIAREMNQVPTGGVLVDRWKRIHLEFHTNASGGAARGCVGLITTSGATTNQAQLATTLADEIDADMLLLDGEFEHLWMDRPSPTYTSAFGAISTSANSDEFDATILELAFHDNQQDAELLRDPRVRAAMARSSVQGIIRFLNWLSGGTVPLAFPPDVPRDVRAEDLGGGNVRLSWSAPLSDGARGDAASSYIVYQSDNGKGFGNPILLGNVLSTTISGVPVEQTRYFRIAATNDGGESMPSEVLAVRRPADGEASILIVNGFDSLRRQQDPVQTFTQPPAYAGQSIDRQMWRRSNSFDYVISYAEALETATTSGFASCSNEAVEEGDIALEDYDIVMWISGEESVEDATFNATEQSLIDTYLQAGGALFASGADIGYDLDTSGNGVSFYEDTLRCDFASDDAGTYAVAATPGGVFDGLPAFDFDFDSAGGALYDVDSPDVITPQAGAEAALAYVGGSGGTAAVQFSNNGIYRVIMLGFPFEAITSSTARADVMQRAVDFLENTTGPLPFDQDNDGDVDLVDHGWLAFCLQGPNVNFGTGQVCLKMDGDGDTHVDLADVVLFQRVFTGD